MIIPYKISVAPISKKILSDVDASEVNFEKKTMSMSSPWKQPSSDLDHQAEIQLFFVLFPLN